MKLFKKFVLAIAVTATAVIISSCGTDSSAGTDNNSDKSGSSVSYYDFVKNNCKEYQNKSWEDESLFSGNSCDVNDIAEPYISFTLNADMTIKEINKNDFNNSIAVLKKRLDIMETPYAIGFGVDITGDVEIYVKTGTEKMGAPVLTLLTYYPDGSIFSDDYETVLMNHTEDFKLNYATAFSYSLNEDGYYDMFVSFDGTKLDKDSEDYDFYYEEYTAFINENTGDNFYWVIANELTAGTITVSEDMGTDSVKFNEISFLGGKKPDKDDEWLLKLMREVLTGEQFSMDITPSLIMEPEFSEGANETDLGYHTGSYVDEMIEASAVSIHPDTVVYRPLNSEWSQLNIEMNFEDGEFDAADFAQKVKKLYQDNPDIGSGSYYTINVEACVNEDGYYSTEAVIQFTKNYDNVVYLNCMDFTENNSVEEAIKEDELLSALEELF